MSFAIRIARTTFVLGVTCACFSKVTALGQDVSPPQPTATLRLIETGQSDEAPPQQPKVPAAKRFETAKKKLTDVRVALPVAEDGMEVPQDFSKELFRTDGERPTSLASRSFTWQASELYHQPLYFDDVPLERYGQTRGHIVQQSR